MSDAASAENADMTMCVPGDLVCHPLLDAAITLHAHDIKAILLDGVAGLVYTSAIWLAADVTRVRHDR